jgi:hypothetical protein
MLTRDLLPEITIGADPELFVRKKQHFISGHLFPCGTKDNPMPTANGMIQNDGLALEINVRPAKTSDEFVTNMTLALGDLNEFVTSVDPEANVVARASVFLGKSKLRVLPPYVYDLGCTPDYNAYHRRGLHPTPKPDFRSPFRTGAGHIHVGWGDDFNPDSTKHKQECAELARYLDMYVGCPSVLWDKDTRRRRMYGQAGSFRPKYYGMEYRVLSNAWVGDEQLTRYVYQQAKRACEAKANNRGIFFAGLQQAIIDTPMTDWAHRFPALAQQVD